MKIKYIFLATLAAALFTACSNDDTPPNPQGDAKISLSIGVSDGSVQTKADPEAEKKGFEGEATITRLTAFIDGNMVKDTTGTDINHIGDIFLDPGTYKLRLIANAEGDIDLDNYDKWAEQKQSSLVMSSEEYTLTLEAMVKNGEPLRLTYYYIGDTFRKQTDEKIEFTKPGDWIGNENAIPLTRLASRIQLKSIKLALQEDLVGGTFTLEKVFLANVRGATKLNTGYEITDAGYYHGMATTGMTDDLINLDGTYSNVLELPYTGVVLADKGIYTVTYDQANNEGKPYWYAFENSGKDTYYTRMIIAGKIVGPAPVSKDYGTRYYQVDITKGDAGIIRNLIYQVDVTIGGLGSDKPETKQLNALIGFDVTVEPWNVIHHIENIED